MTVQAAEEFGELLRICQRGCRTGAAELIATVKTLQTSQGLPRKTRLRIFTGKKKG